MLTRFFIGFITFFLLLCSAIPSHALWWMGYHKPSFQGKVIDADTKAPIEGTVVIVTYRKHAFRFGPHSDSVIIEVKETLTDKEGHFYLPSYTTLIDPLSWEGMANFIIFKPGYGSFKPAYGNFPERQKTPSGLTPISEEIFFSEGVGTEGELKLWVKGEKGPDFKKFKVTFGIVELPKLKTREERLWNIPSLPSVLEFLDKQKNLIRLINEEETNLGLEKSDPYKAREFILKMGR